MPELIKKTYQSIVDNSNDHEVILLSQVNYSSFVEFALKQFSIKLLIRK